MNFPYCCYPKELYYRTVLIEKFKKDRNNTIMSCCVINGVSVFKDPTQKENEFRIGTNGMANNYLVSGNDTISIKTDSSLIQKLTNAIETYKNPEIVK